jgi:hypothetical protein
MAKNGKNRLAILTIFRFRRTDVIPKHKEEATDDIREKGERG